MSHMIKVIILDSSYTHSDAYKGFWETLKNSMTFFKKFPMYIYVHLTFYFHWMLFFQLVLFFCELRVAKKRNTKTRRKFANTNTSEWDQQLQQIYRGCQRYGLWYFLSWPPTSLRGFGRYNTFPIERIKYFMSYKTSKSGDGFDIGISSWFT